MDETSLSVPEKCYLRRDGQSFSVNELCVRMSVVKADCQYYFISFD